MAKRRPALVHGLLAVHKPQDWTSRDVVNHVSGLIGERRCGHTGTLDPAATGVLVLAFGQATKCIRWLGEGPKAYVATVRFGFETTSDDAAGEPIGEAQTFSLPPSRELEALSQRGQGGEIAQVPPRVSALKRDGIRDHVRVRRGDSVDREPRPVLLHQVTLIERGDDWARFTVRCGPGFYVRAWARDLGRLLGCGAHLSDLHRTETSGFSIDDCVTLDELRQTAKERRADQLHPWDEALARVMQTVHVSQELALPLRQGKRPELSANVERQDGPWLLRDEVGEPICVASQFNDGQVWRWRVVRGFSA